MKGIISFFSRQHLFVNLLTIAVLGFGIYVASISEIETFPNVDFDIIFVATIYPGASSTEVERLITTPIEDELKSISGLEEVSSWSVENSSIIVIRLDSDLADKNKTVRDIERAVDNVPDLPKDAEDPVVNELRSGEFPIIEYSISGDVPFKELRDYAKILSDRLINLDGIASVTKLGYKEREIQVNVDPGKIQEFYVSISETIAALKSANTGLAGGKIINPIDEIIIRTNNEFEDAGDVSRTVVRANANGQAVFVRDIAEVVDGYKDESERYRADGSESIILTCVKKEGFDTIRLVSVVDKIIEEFRSELPDGVRIKAFNDMSYYTKRRLKVLLNNGVIGLIGIFVCMLLFLNPVTAVIASLGIPFSIFLALMLFKNIGVTVNMISMVGFIMVLGMLVDDAVVVAENITYYLERGKKAAEAVVTGTAEVLLPVTGSVLTTIAAFFPLMFIAGLMGKFIWAIPFTIIVALAMSLFESLLILPGHLSCVGNLVSIRRNRFIQPLERLYRRVINFNLTHKFVVVLVLGLITMATVVVYVTQMKWVLFPGAGVKMFVVRFKTPPGSSLDYTALRAREIEKVLSSIPEEKIEVFVTKIGTNATNKVDPHARIGSEYGVCMVYLPAESTETEVLDAIMVDVRVKLKSVKGFEELNIEYLKHGPPQGKAIEVAIRGDNFNTLNRVAKEYMDFMATISGVSDIQTNFSPGKTELEVRIDSELAASLAVDPQTVATTVRAGFEGIVATEIRAVEEEIGIRVIFPETIRKSEAGLKNLRVPNRFGKLIPLGLISKFVKKTSVRSIRHRKNMRTIIVSASVDTSVITSVEVNQLVQEKFRDISHRYPGYLVDHEGEFKDTKESIQSILKCLIVSVILVFCVIAITSNSLILPLIIMLSIPFGFVGVVWAFFLHGYPISFLAAIGIVGMAGVVVNNSIVLATIIRRNLRRGLELREAILEGSVRRLRAVILTTVTTLIGLFPTAYGIGGKEEFIQPMVFALAWGLLFGSVITLSFFPVSFYLSHSMVSWLKKKIFPGSALAALLLITLVGVPELLYAERHPPVLPEPKASSSVLELDLETYVKKVVASNFDYEVVELSAEVAKLAWRGIYAMYDTNIESNLSYISDKGRQLFESYPRDLKQRGLNLSLSKKFSPGTFVTLGVDQAFSSYSSMSFLTMGMVTREEHFTNFSLSLSQPLLRNFIGLHDRIKILSLRKGESSSLFNLQEGALDILLGGVKVYYGWLLAGKKLNTTLASREFSEKLLRENKNKFRRGLLEENDIVKTRLLVSQRENDVLVANNELEKARKEMLLYIGEASGAYSAPVNHVHESIPGWQELSNSDIKKIVEDRPKIKAFRLSLRATALSLDYERRAKMPEVNLVLKYDTSGLDGEYSESLSDSLNSDKYPTYYAGLNLSYNLTDASVSNAIKRLLKERKINEVKLHRGRLEVAKAIGQAVSDFKTNRKMAENFQTISGLQKKKLTLEEKLYRQGRSDINNLITFENDVTVTNLLKDKAEIANCISYFVLLRETGRLARNFDLQIGKSEGKQELH